MIGRRTKLRPSKEVIFSGAKNHATLRTLGSSASAQPYFSSDSAPYGSKEYTDVVLCAGTCRASNAADKSKLGDSADNECAVTAHSGLLIRNPVISEVAYQRRH